MMFLRHGIFARKGRLERRRRIQVAAVIGLLLVVVVSIYRLANAAQGVELGGADGLTSGDIVGEFSYAGGEAINVPRNAQVQLDLSFTIDQSKLSAAQEAGQLDYDLSDLTNLSIFNAITSNNQSVRHNAVECGQYVLNGTKLEIEINEDFWTNNYNPANFDLSVLLDIDSSAVETQLVVPVAIPSSINSSDPTTTNTASIAFETLSYTLHNKFYNEQQDSWLEGAHGRNLIDTNAKTVDYITAFSTNSDFGSDFTLTIDLTENQTLSGDIELAFCQGANCIDNTSVKKLAIPAEYLEYSDANSDGNNDRAVISLGYYFKNCFTNGGCMLDDEMVFEKYEILPSGDTSNYHYEVSYHANLTGSTTETYGSTATLASANMESGAFEASQTTEFVGYASLITATKSGNYREESGVGKIDYSVVVSDDDSSALEGYKFEDYISDNQLLEGDIVIKDADGNTVDTISATSVCGADNGCINAGAIDGDYSTEQVKLFEYTIPQGLATASPYTIEYTVRLADAELGENVQVTNQLNVVIDGEAYSNIARTTSVHDYEIPQTYLTKEVADVNTQNGTVEWLIKVYGPDEEGEASFTNIVINDSTTPSVDGLTTSFSSARISTDGTISNPEDANPQVSVSSENGNQVSIDRLSYGQVAYLTFYTQASAEYIEAHAGESIELTNTATTTIKGYQAVVSESAKILQPSPEVLSKTVQEADAPYYELIENGSDPYYQSITRQNGGFLWTVTINENGAGALDEDYVPYFTDKIPAGLLLAGYEDASLTPSYSGNIANDLTQSAFAAVISVKRTVNQGAETSVMNIPVSLVDNQDGSKSIMSASDSLTPINLAELFNTDLDCSVAAQSTSSTSCAGINNTSYTVSYLTAIDEAHWNDVAHVHNFENYAALQIPRPEGFETRAYDSETATYKTKGAIRKEDVSSHDLAADNLIEYNILINEGSKNLNDGAALNFVDVIAENMRLHNSDYLNNGDENDAPIVCIDTEGNNINTDCVFDYDSNTRTITALIPDGVETMISFRVEVVHAVSGSAQMFENLAKITNQYGVEFESSVNEEHLIAENQNNSNSTLELKKVDSHDTSNLIAGVSFNVVEQAYDATTGALIEVTDASSLYDQELTTSLPAGSVVFDGLVAANSENSINAKLYYWQEASAPEPYIADGTKKHYFMLYDATSAYSDDVWANRDAAIASAQLIEQGGSYDLATNGDIAVIPSAYEWLVTNSAYSMSSLKIEKKVKGNGSDTNKSFSITVAATDALGNAAEGVYRAYRYDINNPSVLTEVTDGISFSNGSASIELKHNEGIVFDSMYVGGSYSVSETDYSSEDQGSYQTIYSCDDGDAENGCADDNRSGIIVAGGQTITISDESSNVITGRKSDDTLYCMLAGGCVAAIALFGVVRFRR